MTVHDLFMVPNSITCVVLSLSVATSAFLRLGLQALPKMVPTDSFARDAPGLPSESSMLCLSQ